MQIVVSPTITLTAYKRDDVSQLVELLNNRAIYQNTLRIPYPYEAKDAESWLDHLAQSIEAHNANLAIRTQQGLLIGAIGFDGVQRGQSAELGYWLGEPYWGRGLMTEVVRAACGYALDQWELQFLTAHVFHFNAASARVLEKNGFQMDAHLPAFHTKDEQAIDCKRYILHRTPAAAATPTSES